MFSSSDGWVHDSDCLYDLMGMHLLLSSANPPSKALEALQSQKAKIAKKKGRMKTTPERHTFGPGGSSYSFSLLPHTFMFLQMSGTL